MSNSNNAAAQSCANSTSGNVISTSGNIIGVGAGNNSGWYVTPTTTTTTGTGNIIYQQPYPTTVHIGGSTTIQYKPDRYYIMKLPNEVKKKMPESIYINGMLATLGMFGSDVDVAFTGQDLIFQSGILRALVIGEKIKISIYYKKKIFHFKCMPNMFGGMATTTEQSNILDTELLSMIER